MIVSDVPCYTVCMSKKLSNEEKHKNTLQRETPKKVELDHNCCQILAILREIPRDSDIKCNAEYLKERMGVAKITVYRATSILTDLGIIEFKHGSYVRIDDGKEYFDSDTKKNIALVAGVKGLMQQYKDTPVFNNLVELLYKLEPNLAKDDEIFSSARITVPPQIEYNVNPHNWNKVYEALKRNVKIKFRYKKPYTNQLAQRTVCPYQLLLDDGSVYLFAHSDYAEMELLYDLNFMADIIVTNEEFALPNDFDFKFRCGGGRLGAYKGLNVEKYVIRFTGYAKEWIKHHKWADDQEITEDESSTTITFSSTQDDKVFQLILSWGVQAEPLAPQKLVDRWKTEITALYHKIQK